MKKILLLISCLIISVATAFAAAGLNPYAYKLEYVGQSDNNRKMTVKYWLNAPAEAVTISLEYEDDGAKKVATYSGTTQEGENTVTVSTAGLPANTPISWSVTANKNSRAASDLEPIKISKEYRIYCPHGVAVDVDPMSEYFGRILVTETLHKKTGTSGRNYISSTSATGGTIQAGIYAFDAQFNLINEKGKPYTGDKNFAQKLGSFTSGYGNFDGGHQPFRLKISDDGRIFVSSGDLRGQGAVVWECTKDLSTWYPIIRTDNNNDGTGENFNSNYQLLDANGKFYAGFNCSMDVKGSGENLKLLLYSTDKDGVLNHHIKNFRLDEYPIGNYTGKDFKGTVKNIWATGGAHQYGVVYDNVNVIYDFEDGYWFGGSRGSIDNTTEPNLVHVTAEGTVDERSYSSDFYGGSGILLHRATYPGREGETWLFKGLNGGSFGVWKIYKENGDTKRSRFWTVPSTLGRNHNAFAIDYAENLYVVGNTYEKIVAFSLPYSGTKTTPAKSAFELAEVDNSQTFQVVTNVTPAGYGTTTGDGRYHYEEQVTVTATPSDPNRYEFVEWTTSTGYTHKENPFTFNITRDITFTAHFKVKEYKVEYFKLFKPTEKYNYEYQDITDYYKGDAATMDNKKNTRLWRLFQVQYNETFNCSHKDAGTVTQGGRPLEKVLYFVNARANTDTETQRNRLETLLDNNVKLQNGQYKYAFYWLGQYIEHVINNSTQDISPINYVNVWGFYLQSFINRTITSWDQDIAKNTDVGGTITDTYKVKDFSEAGKPDNWRRWWQEIELGLPYETTYDDAMPTTWKMRTPPTGNIVAGGTTYKPSDWYQWNDAAANPGKLLGWYYGEKNPTTWTDNKDNVEIVHNVYKSGNLIAIWLDKEIHEAKNNYDVAKLMTTQGTTHDVRVYHPLQADMYNTICLPFNVTSLPSDWAGSTVLRLVSSELENEELTEETLSDNNVNLYFEQVDFTKGEQMYAGYPYLIMPQSDVTGWVTFAGVNKDSVYTGEGKSFVTDYVAMHGHINPSEIDVDPNTLFLVANNRLATPSENGEMLGLRGYFTLRGAAAAYSLGEQSVMHIGKKVTTDTPEVPEEEEEVESMQPTINKPKKVMYQGQIYILRGNEVYDLNGRLLRKQ